MVTPGPVEVTEDRDDLYEVEYIIDSHYKRRHLEYLVHWKGYNETNHTWEPKGNLLPMTQVAISNFHLSHSATSHKLHMSHSAFIHLFTSYDNLTVTAPHFTSFDHLEVDL